MEPDDAVQAVAELRGEDALDLDHRPAPVRVAALILREADGVLDGLPDAGVGGHDDDRLGEVNPSPASVKQRAVVEHLEHEVEYGLIGLLDLIEHDNGVRLLEDLVRQSAALAEADVGRLRADELRCRELGVVLGHVDPDDRAPKGIREAERDLGLADAGRAREHEYSDRVVRRLEPGPVDVDAVSEARDCLILPEDRALEGLLEVEEPGPLGRAELLHRHADHARHGLPDGSRVKLYGLIRVLLLTGGAEPCVSRALVDDVKRLVRQAAPGDVALREAHRLLRNVICEADVVELLVGLNRALYDLDRLLGGRLSHLDLLKAPHHLGIAHEGLAVVGKRRRADAVELAGHQVRLHDLDGSGRAAVRCVAAGAGVGGHDGMDLINEEDPVGILDDELKH